MKKMLLMLLCAVLLITTAAYAHTVPVILVNGFPVYTRVDIDISAKDGPYIPVGEIASALGLTYSFDSVSQTAAVENQNSMIAINAGSSTAYIDLDGILYTCSLHDLAPAYMKDGVLMAPLDFISLLPNVCTSWVASSQTITVDMSAIDISSATVREACDSWNNVFNDASTIAVLNPITYYWQQKTLPEMLFNDPALAISTLRDGDFLIGYLDAPWYRAAAIGTAARTIDYNRAIAWNLIESSLSSQYSEYEENDLMAKAKAAGLDERRISMTVTRSSNPNGETVIIIRPDYTPSDSPLIVDVMGIVTNGTNLCYYTVENVSGQKMIYQFSAPNTKELIGTVAPNTPDNILEAILERFFYQKYSRPVNYTLLRSDKIKIESVSAVSIPELENSPQNAFDGSLDTRYSAVNFIATFDLGRIRHVNEIALAFWLYNERSTSYVLSVSSDGVNYSKIFNGSSSLNDVYNFHKVNSNIRYIRLNGYGSETNTWTNLLEIIPFGDNSYSQPKPAIEISSPRLPICTYRAKSIPEPENSPDKAFDGSLDTRYAAVNFDAVFDLGKVRCLDAVRLAFWHYDTRSTEYDLSVSADGINYTPVYQGYSTIGSQYDSLEVAQEARFIRVRGFGNSTGNGWTSLLELEAYGK